MNVGFIGTGVMGSRMVKRFLEAGHSVTVFNRTPEKLEPLLKLGAKKATNYEEIARQSEIICTCLSMPKDSMSVFLEKDGILQHAKVNTILIDFSTVDAETSKRIFSEAKRKNVHFLDAPVSGGPEGVEQGTLTIMIGGESEIFEKAHPLFKSIGTTIEYLGPTGSGSVAKLINQYLVAVHSVAASEAMVAGVALGLDSQQLYNLLKVSYGDSRMLERHMEQFVLSRQFEPGGAVKYVHKDVALANRMFEKTGITENLGQFAQSLFAKTMEDGFSDLDMSAVIKPLEKKCGVVVKGMAKKQV